MNNVEERGLVTATYQNPQLRRLKIVTTQQAVYCYTKVYLFFIVIRTLRILIDALKTMANTCPLSSISPYLYVAFISVLQLNSERDENHYVC